MPLLASKCISIYGREDKSLNLETFEKSKKYLPENQKVYVINGGNHSGFANYSEQKNDGKAKITPEEQQNYAVQKIISSILE